MERLKQFLAFPLYATVAWLVWVLGAQVDNDAVVRLLVTLVVLSFALWAWRAYRGGGARMFSVAALLGLVGVVVVAWPLYVAPTRSAGARSQAQADAAPAIRGSPSRPALVTELAARASPCSSTSPRRGA